MLTSHQLNNYADPPPRRQKSQSPHTTDFGIQVDLNYNPESVRNSELGEENEQVCETKCMLSPAEKRKLSKKLSKKRKRQKSQQMQRQARRQIGNIIQQLYQRTSRFEDYAEKIEILVELVYNNDFRDYLDQLIRMRVTNIQKSIWQFTQSILYQNPFERNEDHAFYSQMVDQIYDRFLELQQSSKEIEKIINIYLKFAYQKSESKEEIVYNNLAINTFNYMIETDQTLKNLLHICEKKISPTKEVQRKKLEELISYIDTYDEDYNDDQSSTSCPNDELMSTGLSEEDDSFMGKRRKRRKIKESELITNQDSLTRRLETLTIREEERTPCRVSEDWLKKMEMKAVKYRAS